MWFPNFTFMLHSISKQKMAIWLIWFAVTTVSDIYFVSNRSIFPSKRKTKYDRQEKYLSFPCINFSYFGPTLPLTDWPRSHSYFFIHLNSVSKTKQYMSHPSLKSAVLFLYFNQDWMSAWNWNLDKRDFHFPIWNILYFTTRYLVLPISTE